MSSNHSNTPSKAMFTTSTPLLQSPLFRLPPELRNRISDYSLLGDVQEFRFPYGQYPRFPALLHVCKQTRQETQLSYFRLAHFEFVAHWHGLEPLYRYLRVLTPETRAQLWRNGHFSIHIIFDNYHPQYNVIQKWLRGFSYGHENFGPYITAEDFNKERGPIQSMRNKSARLPARQARKMAEAKEVAEKGWVAFEAHQAEKRKAMAELPGRATLHNDLSRVWWQVMRVLGEK